MTTTTTVETAHYNVTDYLQALATRATGKALASQWSHPRHGIKERNALRLLSQEFLKIHCFDRDQRTMERPKATFVTSTDSVLAWALESYGNWILQGRPEAFNTEASDALRMAAKVKDGTFFTCDR
jgi:hypothetical protein